MPNTVAAITRQLVEKIDFKADTLVVCEATGGYEHVVVDAMRKLLTIINDMVRRGISAARCSSKIIEHRRHA